MNGISNTNASLNYLHNFIIKTDIKETGINPYSLPFNYQLLLER